MKAVIDRFEGSYAVCERDDQEMVSLKKSSLPPDASEGDVINIDSDPITIDKEETIRRRKLVEELTKDMWS